MSEFINKPGLGTMRANKYKESDNHPDIKGEITLHGGEIVKFAGWKRTDKNGGTYYSLKQDRPREDADAFRGGGDAGVAGGQAGASSRASMTVILDDDDLPFIRSDTVW